jgi:hypothetical protein
MEYDVSCCENMEQREKEEEEEEGAEEEAERLPLILTSYLGKGVNPKPLAFPVFTMVTFTVVTLTINDDGGLQLFSAKRDSDSGA